MTTLNPALNFDTREPRATNTVVNNPDNSPMFPAAPVYARTAKKKPSNNLALLVGAPVVLVAAGAIGWMMLAGTPQTPAATEVPAQMEVARSETLTPPLAPEIATPAPAPAAMPAPVQTAAVETPAPRATAPVRAQRPAPVRRAAPVEAAAPDAASASTNVSATVPAPAPVAQAPAAIVAEPAPLVIPAPAAPAPVSAPAPVTPVVPQ